MLEALHEAWKAFQLGEVPVGAVLVTEGRVVARAHNRVEATQDATAHAEMLCLRAAAAWFGNWRLPRTALYCTIEPCSMCAGALLLARVPLLVWGAPDKRHGANGSWVDLFGLTHPTHTLEVRKGVLPAYGAQLLRNFFGLRRRANMDGPPLC